ncbi:serine hydrolase domain-containing protein [Saccharothrix australiensis]|uniref:serine hydrolase domain-containing protein n=1 Tax=Saccharothrix australiensis TaxID=2072 RepID=UPI001FE2A98A|nr:serine hydrolase domain-containing protein [Saccharothrix australiensis]
MFTTILTTLALTASVLDPVGSPTAVDAAAVDSIVERYREEVALPGAAVAVTRGDTVVHAAGYGRTPGGDAITERTTLAVASVSKSFTALAVLQLAERGRIGLDDPVQAHLPEFTMADPRAGAITVRQLLDQTSGMSDTTSTPFSGPAVHTLREAVASMREAGLADAPGSTWRYHNPNFQVAARLVEVVSGVPFAEYLRRNVFDPLGMTGSGTGDTERDLPPSARGHVRVLGVPLAVPEPPAFGNGSGGVLSTARDMAAWLIAQNNGGRGANGTSIATPDGIAATHTPSGAAKSYGLGWFVGTTASGAPLVHHSGDLFTSTAYQALLPASGHGVAVMANTGLQHGDAQAIAERLIAAIEGREPPPAGDPWPAVVDAVLLGAAVVVGVATWRGARRSRRWATRRRSAPWAVVRLVPLALPLLLLVTVHRVVGFLYRGRDVSWRQVPYLYPTFVVLLAVAAVGCAAVLVARAAAVVRAARRPVDGAAR